MKKFFTFLVFAFVMFRMTAQMPATFDLRDFNGKDYVTSVKSQQGGTCWTHGTMASIEGNLMMTGNWSVAGETGEPALAEYHLDWWNGYNSYYNQDLTPPFNNGEGLDVHNGGDYRVSTAYISRLDGVVREIDGQSFDDPSDRKREDFHFYYPKNVEWYTAGADLENIDLIKSKIMEHGVLATCICYNSSFMDSQYNHYQPFTSNSDPNHSVSIVGWDDYRVTQAPLPGAWIVKNSWGTGWGVDGYFWISYYDKQACQNPEMGAVSFYDVELLQYDTAYYYDYHGWRDTLTTAIEAFNAFTADNSDAIVAVNFFTAAENVDYTVKIYDDFNEDSLENELATISGNFQYSGMHTVDFPDAVNFLTGDDFYVYLYLSEGGFPYDRTSEVPVLLGAKYRTIVPSVANPGESYFNDNGVWSDFYYYDDGSGFQNTGNICIKALAVHDPTIGINPEMGGLNEINDFNYPNPFNETTNICYNLNTDKHVKLVVYSAEGKQVELLVDELQTAGDQNVTLTTLQQPGVYFYRLYFDNVLVNTHKMVKVE